MGNTSLLFKLFELLLLRMPLFLKGALIIVYLLFERIGKLSLEHLSPNQMIANMTLPSSSAKDSTRTELMMVSLGMIAKASSSLKLAKNREIRKANRFMGTSMKANMMLNNLHTISKSTTTACTLKTTRTIPSSSSTKMKAR
jgi:hypothetical protein